MNRTTKLLCVAAAAIAWMVIVAVLDNSMMPLAWAVLTGGIAAVFWVAGRMQREASKQEREYAERIRLQGREIR